MLRARLAAFGSRRLGPPIVSETNDGVGFSFDAGGSAGDRDPSITRTKHTATSPSKQLVPLSPLELPLQLSPPPYTDLAPTRTNPSPFNSGVITPLPLSWNRNEADVREYDLGPFSPENAGGKGKERAELDELGSSVSTVSPVVLPDISDFPDEKDFEYAIQLQIEEFRKVADEFEDEKMARRLAGDVVQDTSPSNQRYNLRPRTGSGAVSNTAAGPSSTSLTARNSTKRGATRSSASVLTRECTSCFESLQLFQGIQSSCEHYYCLTCVRNLVNASISDNSFALFPPKCCNKPLMAIYAQGTRKIIDDGDDPKSFMQIELLGLVLDDAALKERLEKRWKEWSTKDEDRVYCCGSGCAQFLGSAATDFEVADLSAEATTSANGRKTTPRSVGLRLFTGSGSSKKAIRPQPSGIAKCSACLVTTCVLCRQPGHAGKSCLDSGDTLFWDTVRVRGWKKCPGCSVVIEKNGGCSHVVCRCGRSFNY